MTYGSVCSGIEAALMRVKDMAYRLISPWCTMSPMEELKDAVKDTIEPAPDPEQAALLLRVEDVAQRLSLAKSTVYALLASGQLPCVRIGRSVRVPAEQLREWVAERSG